MTFTTTTRSRRPGAFTLAEVMIGATIGSLVLVGVLSAFLMLGRSGTNIVAYTSMDTQTRRALEEFGQDVRMASDLTWNSTTSITLTVPDNYTATANHVTYAWDNVAGSATYRCFYRKPGTAAENDATLNRKTTYITNVTSFTFRRYNRNNLATETTTDPETKRIRIEMTLTTTNRTVVSATDTTLSATFVMRNKPSN